MADAIHPKQILFEDNNLVAVFKPPGLPTQATRDPNRPHLFGQVTEFLKQRDGKSAYVGLHHRLDLDTTGVVLFTKSRRVNGPIGKMFQNHEIQKTYLAFCEVRDVEKLSQLQGEGLTVSNHLKSYEHKDAATGRKFQKMKTTASGGDRAETHFRLLKEWPGAALIEAQPRTGRMHQIRVHLSESLGMPIMGDRLYGARNEPFRARRVMLHAAKLQLRHPLTQKDLIIEAPWPGDFQSMEEKLGR